jgi:hypothetical protein
MLAQGDTPAQRMLLFQLNEMFEPGTIAFDARKKIDELLNDPVVSEAVWMAATRQEARDMSRVIKRLVAINNTLKGYRRVDPGEQLVHRFSPKRIAEIKRYACKPRSSPYNRHLDDMILTDLPLGVLLEDGRRFHTLSSSLSLAGPGGFSLLLRSNIAYLPEIILVTRNGLKSFNHYPWRRGYLVKKGEPIGDMTWYNNDLHGCPLCDSQEDGPYHLACECQHKDIVAFRQRMRASLCEMLPKFATALVRASARSGVAKEAIAIRLGNKLQQVKAECRRKQIADFLLYRMLLALPHPAFIAEEHKALGTIFDEAWVLPRHSSVPANMIVQWATDWLMGLAKLRLSLLPPSYYGRFDEAAS